MRKVYCFAFIALSAVASVAATNVYEQVKNIEEFAVGSTGVNWRTVSEQHAMGYKLQYSLEGTAYVPIATFQLLGAGKYYYAFSPQSGYYKLQMWRLDGKHYSTAAVFYTDKHMGETNVFGRSYRRPTQPDNPVYHVSE